LAIGGLDPSGRAGVLADVATIRAQGAEALAVVTCLTAQGRRSCTWPVSARQISAQLQAAADSGPLHAVKVGVLPDRQALTAVVKWLKKARLPTVVDPVRESSKGLQLSTLAARDYLRLAWANVVLTPNLLEWEALGWTNASQGLRGLGAVVVKSFAPGRDAVFVRGKRPIWLEANPLPRTSLHRGTGCRFASALAVELANGHTVVHAARTAKRAVRKFLATPILRPI
jgi:hydroxymethylpyrimidine/phosphomethylpyrimidine kinase